GEGEGLQNLPGGLNLLGGDVWDASRRLPGAFLHEPVCNLKRLGDLLLVAVEVELQPSLAAMAIEAIVVGEEGRPWPEGNDQALAVASLGDRIGREKAPTNQLPQVRSELIPFDDRSVIVDLEAPEPLPADV